MGPHALNASHPTMQGQHLLPTGEMLSTFSAPSWRLPPLPARPLARCCYLSPASFIFLWKIVRRSRETRLSLDILTVVSSLSTSSSRLGSYSFFGPIQSLACLTSTHLCVHNVAKDDKLLSFIDRSEHWQALKNMKGGKVKKKKKKTDSAVPAAATGK